MTELRYSARLSDTKRKFEFSLLLTPQVLQQWIEWLGEEDVSPPVKRTMPLPADCIVSDDENNSISAEWVKYSNWFTPSIYVACNGVALDDGGMLPQRAFDVGPIQAAMCGQVEALKTLLDFVKHAGKEAKPSWRTQCMQEAIRRQDIEMVRMLEAEHGRLTQNQISWIVSKAEDGQWLRSVHRELDLGATVASPAIKGVRSRL